ncbi:MAG: hypothetical protein MK179_05350, partial [Pirellulaceae bacterium]|nr:hypothetical protein [Pirellulaceae bacterium]
DFPNFVVHDHAFHRRLQHTLGSLNTNYRANPGAPDIPFPWLTWLNRPYVSQYELMQVPKTSSSRLTAMFTLARANEDPFENDPKSGSNHIPFGHLLNFFETNKGNQSGPQLGRIFDYLRVPSRFAGTSTQLDPERFTGGESLSDGRQLFHPPFNTVSNFRDPGRVNMNTIYSDSNASNFIWEAIMGEHPGPNYQQLEDSRRGYPGAELFAFNDSQPTFFANPLRSFGSAEKVPLANLTKPEAAVTLMRPDQADASGSIPLFQKNIIQGDYNDPDRNSYFRYQGLQRIENLVTNRSNVFAIWITVGYFEVDKKGLGLEIGTDTGDIKRHRAFYIVDRTIPVGFEPGKDHNVDKAVILRRYLE